MEGVSIGDWDDANPADLCRIPTKAINRAKVERQRRPLVWSWTPVHHSKVQHQGQAWIQKRGSRGEIWTQQFESIGGTPNFYSKIGPLQICCLKLCDLEQNPWYEGYRPEGALTGVSAPSLTLSWLYSSTNYLRNHYEICTHEFLGSFAPSHPLILGKKCSVLGRCVTLRKVHTDIQVPPA